MRISDWSSDVCSSDLDQPRIIAQRHLEAPRVIDLRDEAAVGDPGRVATKIAVVARHRLQSFEALRDPCRDPAVLRLLVETEVALQIFEHAKIVERVDVARSEEHTSELQ